MFKDARLARSIFTLVVEHDLGIKVLGLQLVGCHANGFGDLIQRFVADGGTGLLKGIGQVVTLVQFARSAGCGSWCTIDPCRPSLVPILETLVCIHLPMEFRVLGCFNTILDHVRIGMDIATDEATTCSIAIIALGIMFLPSSSDRILVHASILTVRRMTTLAGSSATL